MFRGRRRRRTRGKEKPEEIKWSEELKLKQEDTMVGIFWVKYKKMKRRKEGG